MISVDEQLCTGCAMCVPACPEGAISCFGIAGISDDCLDCMACLPSCPSQALGETQSDGESHE